MEKRERLEKTIAGELVDRPAVALWRHWQGDDQRAVDLAQAHLDFQAMFDWDILIVSAANHYMLTGYGLQDEWRGNLYGQRELLKSPINRSLAWTDLRPQDPNRGDLGKQIQALQAINAQSDKNLPLLQVVYSPLSQALALGGRELLLRNMRTQADRLRTGLNTLTETSLRFLEALRRNTHISGLLYIVDMACYTLLSEAEYLEFGLPYDQKLLENLPSDWWLTMIQVRGEAPMLDLFANLPVQALNWSEQEARPSLEAFHGRFKAALCGGLGENKHLHFGTPNSIRDASRDAINRANRRLILGTGMPIPVSSPISNIRAARESVEALYR